MFALLILLLMAVMFVLLLVTVDVVILLLLMVCVFLLFLYVVGGVMHTVSVVINVNDAVDVVVGNVVVNGDVYVLIDFVYVGDGDVVYRCVVVATYICFVVVVVVIVLFVVVVVIDVLIIGAITLALIFMTVLPCCDVYVLIDYR